MSGLNQELISKYLDTSSKARCLKCRLFKELHIIQVCCVTIVTHLCVTILNAGKRGRSSKNVFKLYCKKNIVTKVSETTTEINVPKKAFTAM